MDASSGNERDASRCSDHRSQYSDQWIETAHAPSPAASIKDYSLQAFLGEGSTAHVYLATRVDNHEQVAIKVIDKLLVRQAQMQHKVQREILLHAPLRHRHVVRVREAFEDTRNHYIVLEYCQGGSVASLVRSLRGQGMTMDETTAKSIFRQTALGVAYLHARGIIHRDLKLSNILLTDDGDVKISDFGLATLMSDEHGTVCGTPNFIAPEVLSASEDSAPYDETADIWSLGCILYTLLLGKPPFEGPKVSDTLMNVTNAGLQPLDLPRGFSATISDLLKRMLNRHATSRPTVAQILAHPWLRASTPTRGQEQPPLNAHQDHRSIGERAVRSLSSERPKETRISRRRRSVGRSHTRPASAKHRLGYESDESSASDSGSFSGFDLRELNVSLDASGHADDSSDVLGSDGDLSSEISRSMTTGDFDRMADAQLPAADKDGVAELGELHTGLSIRSSAAECASQGPTGTDPPKEVHFLQMRVEVIDLPLLGIAPDSATEITWDCWETSDIRQLTRFVLRVRDKELEYVPSKGLIHGCRPDGSHIRHICAPSLQSSPMRTGAPGAASDDDLERIVRLCQCLALRALQLRRAAMAVDVENLPMVHFDRLPESMLASLRQESVRATLTRLLGQTAVSPPSHDRGLTRCVLPGVGLGEFDASGRLIIHFFSGPTLQMNASGSTIRYRRSPSDHEDEFDLATAPFLPTEVKKHFEHVAAFVRQLQTP